MELYENWYPDSIDFDIFTVVCTLIIFFANTVSVLYILWSVTPLIKSARPIGPISGASGNKTKEFSSSISSRISPNSSNLTKSTLDFELPPRAGQSPSDQTRRTNVNKNQAKKA